MSNTIYTKKGYLNSKGIREAYSHYEKLRQVMGNKMSKKELDNMCLGVRAGIIRLRHDPTQQKMSGYSMQVFDGQRWSKWL
jgi:hypothetical protein